MRRVLPPIKTSHSASPSAKSFPLASPSATSSQWKVCGPLERHFSTDTTDNVALAWDTTSGGNNKLDMWLDGTHVLEKDGLTLWMGNCYTKYGIYRGEKGDYDLEGHSNVFDSYVYGVQVSDASLSEVADYSGLGGKSRIRW